MSYIIRYSSKKDREFLGSDLGQISDATSKKEALDVWAQQGGEYRDYEHLVSENPGLGPDEIEVLHVSEIPKEPPPSGLNRSDVPPYTRG